MAYRPRACQPCRTRREKCDETFPSCLQCTRAGRVCTGLTGGAMISDLTQKTASKIRESKHSSEPLRLLAPSISQASSSSSIAASSSSSDAASSSSTISSFSHVRATRTRKPSQPRNSSLIISPSQLPILVQNFFTNFLDNFTTPNGGAPGEFWLHRLPSTPFSSDTNGLELAIQAVSIAFCGSRSAQPAYIRGSRDIYGRALEAHKSAVARLSDQRPPSSQMLCTTLMMAFYEGMEMTEPEGYLRHLEGAARMFEILGPERCEEDVVKELFFVIRTQMLLVTFLTKQRSLFASGAFMAVSYEGGGKPVFEKLMDLVNLLLEEYNHPLSTIIGESQDNLTDLAALQNSATESASSNSSISKPAVLSAANDTASNTASAPIYASEAEEALKDLTLGQIDERINRLWQEFKAEFLSDTPIHWSQVTQSFIYPTAFSAYIISYFDLARILSSLILLRTQPTPYQPNTQTLLLPSTASHANLPANDVINQASASILSTAEYLETQNLGCAFVRMMLPLLVVGLHSVESRQRMGARQVLERWEAGGIVKGLAGLCLRAIKRSEGEIQVE